jgi:predicted transcriptional regulator
VDQDQTPQPDLRQLVADVAEAYFRSSHVAAAEIPGVIGQIASSLGAVGTQGASHSGSAQPAEEQPQLTRAQVRKSITADGLISFEDGRPYKSLRRHLTTRGLTPDQYRTKWGLPADYPMVAASYSAKRSELAKSFGLGQRIKARGQSVP